MAQEYFEIVFRLVAALLAGGLIGLERSHRGRPAGFRDPKVLEFRIAPTSE